MIPTIAVAASLAYIILEGLDWLERKGYVATLSASERRRLAIFETFDNWRGFREFEEATRRERERFTRLRVSITNQYDPESNTRADNQRTRSILSRSSS
jgi:hypothetical protein